ncbi:MAG: DUF92 domain-containing protein [Candidatus Neomarinimicrobiota bacterium]
MPFRPILPSPFMTWMVLLAGISALLALAEWLHRRDRLPPETLRPLVHAVTGVGLVLTPFLFRAPTFPLLSGFLFLAVNLLAVRGGRLPAIHATARSSYGTVFYPLAYVILVALLWERDQVALLVGILILAFADPLAAAVGRRYGGRPFTLWRDSKTYAGSLIMLAASTLLTLAGLYVLVPLAGGAPMAGPHLLIAALLAGALAAVVEAQSRQGSDNLTVPLAAGLFIVLFRALPTAELPSLVGWAGGSALILGAAARLRALAASGAITAWAMGLLVYLAGGWTWVLPLAAFFLLSALLTLLHHLARGASQAPPHAGRRTLVQVMANGGIPLLLALAYGLWRIEALYLVFIAALAAAAADTWATEIGGWLGGEPRSIVTWKAVPRGSSGGVTAMGTLGSLAGAATLAAVGLSLAPQALSVVDWAAITLIGFTAALIDSLLGATVQVRFLDPSTGRIVEEVPPGQQLQVHSGWRWLDNHMVNLVCSASGALLALFWLRAGP